MNKLRKNTRDEIEQALADHIAEVGKKRGWMPSTTRLFMIAAGIAIAVVAGWLTSCGSSINWGHPDYGSIIIAPPSIEIKEGK